jgi:hypothetical protein
MHNATSRSLLTMSLLAASVAACTEEPADALSNEIAVFESKLEQGATPTEACKELEVLCSSTGFGCKAHELFCKVPTKEYICQQLAAACVSYPAACDVHNTHCKTDPAFLDAGLPPADRGPIVADACALPPEKCCAGADLECRGGPETGVVCKCRWAWENEDGGQTDRAPSPGPDGRVARDAGPGYPDGQPAADLAP